MAMPTVASVGALTGSQTPLTLTAPASFVANDILLAFYTVEQNETVTLTTANGFVETASSPQTAVIGGGIKIHCFWKRAAGSDSMPVSFDPTDHVGGFVVAVRGCKTSGNPWNTSSGGGEAVADNSLSIPGATTTASDCLVIGCVADGVSNVTSARWSGWANPDLANIAEIADGGSTTGGGWGFGAFSGELAISGAYGATTATFFTSNFKAYMTLALEGAPSASSSGGDRITHVRSGLRLS